MSTLSRAVAGTAIYAAVCAVLTGPLNLVMQTWGEVSRSAYLVVAGPVGALTTHLHVLGFLALTFVLLPLLVSGMLTSTYRRHLLAAFLVLWAATGIGFALVWQR